MASSKTKELSFKLLIISGVIWPKSVAILILLLPFFILKPHGSAASCGIENGCNCKSPTVKSIEEERLTEKELDECVDTLLDAILTFAKKEKINRKFLEKMLQIKIIKYIILKWKN